MATKSFKVKKFLSLTLAFAVLMGLVSIRSAHAQDCRQLQSVIDSADPFRNTGMAGHINKHIFAAQAPHLVNNSALNATMYRTIPNWNSLWGTYQNANILNPPQCPALGAVNPFHDDIAPNALPARGQVNGHDCTAVDGNNHTQCTTLANQFAPSNYRFVFAWRGGQWIILTAYPRP